MTHREPVFGLSITPDNVERAFTLARTADELGLDIIGVQDHPYNGTFLDTWTLISALATSTKKIRYFYRCKRPSDEAAGYARKSISHSGHHNKSTCRTRHRRGRVLGRNSLIRWAKESPVEAVVALEEAIQVIHLIWNYGGPRRRVSFPGKHYQLQNAQAGPSPYHNIGIWLGATRSRMMELIGRSGDGWVIPLTSMFSDAIRAAQQLINAAAKKTARSPDSIARISNIIGVIDEQGKLNKSSGEKTPFTGSSSQWVDWIVSSYRGLGVDTFVFWPAAEGQEESQLRLFA